MSDVQVHRYRGGAEEMVQVAAGALGIHRCGRGTQPGAELHKWCVGGA
jgi:hypothetical protein